jgi:hypothetical protein
MRRIPCLFALGVFVAAGALSTASGAERGAKIRAILIKEQVPRTDAAEPIPPGESEESNWRYRRQNGRWWYWTDENRWAYWNGSRWVAPSKPAAGVGDLSQAQEAEGAVEGERSFAEPPRFRSWFNAYRNFQTGRPALQTAEEGSVELATGEIAADMPAEEVFEYGGIPRRQARRERPVTSGAIRSGGAWFNAGSPTGIKYGYGSGYGYGGYGFDNPYGYGSRSGSGGAYGYGFGAFGSVGGQTGERLSSLITGGAEPRLIGPEPPGIGAPAKLESTVGGTVGRAGLGARELGGSAAGDD